MDTAIGQDGDWDWDQLRSLAFSESHRILRNRHDAEDAAQEAVLRAFRARAANPESRQAWVRIIARRESYRLIGRRLLLSDGTSEDAPAPDPCEGVPERISDQDAVRRAEAGDLALLVRRYVLEQPASEIAAEMSIPSATVRVRLHRAAKRVRDHLNSSESS